MPDRASKAPIRCGKHSAFFVRDSKSDADVKELTTKTRVGCSGDDLDRCAHIELLVVSMFRAFWRTVL